MAVKKLNYLLDAGSKNYSNLLLDASHRVEPVNTVVVCAMSKQIEQLSFFLLSSLPLGLRVGMKVPCVSDGAQMGIPVSAPSLCMGPLDVHGMRGLSGEL